MATLNARESLTAEAKDAFMALSFHLVELLGRIRDLEKQLENATQSAAAWESEYERLCEVCRDQEAKPE